MCSGKKKEREKIEEPASKRETEQISARKKNRATCSFTRMCILQQNE
jgi:hypothetical protein